MEDFATYILEEKNISQKMLIVYYLSKKSGVFFDKSIVLKAEIAKLFIEFMKIDVDENFVLTAMLLCNCKKVENAQKIGRLETFAKEGAQYLETLGFSKRFCKICEEVNRYSNSFPRERESDIIEVVDQFTGLILDRVERDAYNTKEALVILEERNLKYVSNRYLELFKEFILELEDITIKEDIEVPIIKKLVHIHNKEANVKALIATLTNRYSEKIEKALSKTSSKKAEELLNKINSEEGADNVKSDIEKMKDLTESVKNSARALFSEDTAEKILNHESNFKMEE
ncbi:MAG: hypothetical protein IKF38_06265 [Clostridia bacterium]|nr:hypothetical protein [Clostridia bacterium]